MRRRRRRQRHPQRLAGLARQQAEFDQIADVVARGLEILPDQRQQRRRHLVGEDAVLLAGRREQAVTVLDRHVQQRAVRGRHEVSHRLGPPRPRQRLGVEHEIERRPPRLGIGLQRAQDRHPVLRRQPGRRPVRRRRVDRRRGGAERGGQRQQIAVEPLQQRLGRQHHGAGRERLLRRVEPHQAAPPDLQDALAHGGVVEQEHLLDQPVEFADGRAAATAGRQIGDDLRLRAAVQAGEGVVPGPLPGREEADHLASGRHQWMAARWLATWHPALQHQSAMTRRVTPSRIVASGAKSKQSASRRTGRVDSPILEA